MRLPPILFAFAVWLGADVAAAVQIISHRLHQQNVEGRAHLFTPHSNATQIFTLISNEFEHEFVLEGSAPTVNKIYLSLIVMLQLGFCGVDRCFMGQLMLGVAKCITFGGCGMWHCADYVILLVNCLLSWKSIDVFFFHARFKDEHVEVAFWIALIALIGKCCSGVCTPKYEAKAAMRRRGLLSAMPSEDEIKLAFEKIDADGNGVLTLDELLQGCELLGVPSDKCAQLFQTLDKDKSGKISYEEFFEHYSKL
eukprot:TRINITY_DN10707_c0_g1_i2.p1 TRINITY_DN10707_c0_g1~~TRINITY_DN10707_c0_g1_i2.p1  ORF type:complete len:273 (-),score=50.93 TRINITY_DN10707_c0_g1_i2:221-979(-)